MEVPSERGAKAVDAVESPIKTGRVTFSRLERIVIAENAADALVEEVRRLRSTRVWLVTGRTLSRETDIVSRLRAALGERYAGNFDRMSAFAPREDVIACAEMARDAAADLIVGVGGGSVTDGAKIVTLALEHNLRASCDLDAFKVTVQADGTVQNPQYRAPSTPLICVPTTLSAAEYFDSAGVTDSVVRFKHRFSNPGLIPKTVILDPAVTLHTPESLFLSTGVRALDHAIETICSMDANAYTDALAFQALGLLASGLAAVRADPNDLAARQRCLIGSWLSMAGISSGARMGASHAIGHILGGVASVPHGYTSCVMLPAVLAFNAPSNEPRQSAIAAALGNRGGNAAEVVARFIQSLGLPRNLREVHVDRSMLASLSERCMMDAWTYSNPRPIRSSRDILALLISAY